MPEPKAELEFLVDTSVLVNIRDEHNDSAEIWEMVIAAIKAGRLKTVRQVWGELQSRFPEIALRFKRHRKKFLIDDTIAYSEDVVAEVRYLNQHHRALWNPIGGRNPADPLLVATAKVLSIVVVTDEKRKGPGHQKRIPYVCTQRNVGCTDRLDFLRKIGCDV